MAEMHEWDEPGFWVKKKPAKDNMKLTHVAVSIKDIEEVLLLLSHANHYGVYDSILKKLQAYLPED